MLFSAKPQGIFIEYNNHATLVARTSGFECPLVIEDVRECVPGDAEGLAAALRELQPKGSAGNYVHAVCGVYPPRRLVRHTPVDVKRIKEAEYLPYLNDLVASQFRVDPEKCTLMVLNAHDGATYDRTKAAQKEVLICGLPIEDIVATQDALLASGIYPVRMEMATVATLGAMVDYLAFTQSKTPVLVLELGMDTTHSFIVTADGVDAARPIQQGLESMVPIVQKELGLKDEESARKLFYSNTFDFAGMGQTLIKKLIKELQSSIGFYEVQTGQSIGHVCCTQVPPKMSWIDHAIAGSLGVGGLELSLEAWLQRRGVTLAPAAAAVGRDGRWLGLLSLMVQYKNVPVEDKK